MTFIDHYWQPKVSATTLIDFTSTYINFSSSSSNKKDTFKVLLFEDSSTFKASKNPNFRTLQTTCSFQVVLLISYWLYDARRRDVSCRSLKI